MLMSPSKGNVPDLNLGRISRQSPESLVVTSRKSRDRSMPLERRLVICVPPMRSVIWSCLDQRENFKDITILYGARTVGDLVYKHELAEWKERPDVNLVTTVDPGGETPDWKGEVGFVPTILDRMQPVSENTVAIVCGPPVMIKFTFPVLGVS